MFEFVESPCLSLASDTTRRLSGEADVTPNSETPPLTTTGCLTTATVGPPAELGGNPHPTTPWLMPIAADTTKSSTRSEPPCDGGNGKPPPPFSSHAAPNTIGTSGGTAIADIRRYHTDSPSLPNPRQNLYRSPTPNSKLSGSDGVNLRHRGEPYRSISNRKSWASPGPGLRHDLERWLAEA